MKLINDFGVRALFGTIVLVGGIGSLCYLAVIGNDNLIMAYAHIAHDCYIGNYVTLANAVTLAGYVHIEDRAIIGGMTGIHQFVKVGRLAIIGGLSKLVKDIPPYAMADGRPAKIYGVNSIGLDRSESSGDVKAVLKKAYKILLSKNLTVKDAAEKIEGELLGFDEIQHLVDFIRQTERGIAR